MPRGSSKTPVALGCHVFAGGFTIGVLSAGFKVTAHLEGEAGYGSKTFSHNYPHIPVYKGGWENVGIAGVDFIYGNPPCAAWSGNNPNAKSAGWEKDPRVECTRAMFKLLETGRPKVWAWESVCLAPVRGKPFVDRLTEASLRMGYSVTQVFHDAMYLGVPQTRKRWFFVAHNVHIPWEEPKWDGVASAAAALRKITPRGDRAYDCPVNRDLVEPQLSKVKPGERFRYIWSRLDPKYKGGSIPLGHGQCRVKDKGPSCATVGYGMAHPTKHRFLTVNEVQALAGFPDEFEFLGGKNGSAQLDLIARGVCPPVGAWLARSVMAAIKANKRITKPFAQVRDYRKPGIDPIDVTGDYARA